MKEGEEECYMIQSMLPNKCEVKETCERDRGTRREGKRGRGADYLLFCICLKIKSLYCPRMLYKGKEILPYQMKVLKRLHIPKF